MATQRIAAFLRSINVGGHRVKMDQLRELLSELGLENVAAFLASGNLAFDLPVGESSGDFDAVRQAELERRIGGHLHHSLGYEVDTFLRPLSELERVTRSCRRALSAIKGEDFRAHVLFLHDEPSEAAKRNLRKLESDSERLRVRGTEVFWLRRGRFSDSEISLADLSAALEGASATVRTLETVERIAGA